MGLEGLEVGGLEVEGLRVDGLEVGGLEPPSPTSTPGSSAQSKAPSATAIARFSQAQLAAFSAAASALCVPSAGHNSQHALLASRCFSSTQTGPAGTLLDLSALPAAITLLAPNSPLLPGVSGSTLSPPNRSLEDNCAGVSHN
ncbi:hypothetical protein XENTR_v10010230 [Xenopus tropicalis]|nr:hypothetical protein XENTR_v10010230 [Xenopus tropicalis]